jgi:hypothetical protein
MRIFGGACRKTPLLLILAVALRDIVWTFGFVGELTRKIEDFRARNITKKKANPSTFFCESIMQRKEIVYSFARLLVYSVVKGCLRASS